MAILDADKLNIYNGALRRLGSGKLASLAENREPRRVMDDIWGPSSEVVKGALERGEWNFAIRTLEGVYSTSVEPDFGLSRAYNKPDDFCRLVGLCADPYFEYALLDKEYVEEAGYWFTDLDVIYIRYISSDDSYGFNSSLWLENFKEYLECKMAWEACERLTNSAQKKQLIERDMDKALTVAKSHDAMGDGTKFVTEGTWRAARASRRGYSYR